MSLLDLCRSAVGRSYETINRQNKALTADKTRLEAENLFLTELLALRTWERDKAQGKQVTRIPPPDPTARESRRSHP